ncbi:hypothetical protein PFISCL1PPCAC_23715, partial [Pristionchus fissidentatus]
RYLTITHSLLLTPFWMCPAPLMSRYRSQNFIPEGAKVHNLDELSSDDSEDDFFSEDDFKSYPSVSDESSEPPLPVRHFDDRYGSLPRDKYRDDRRRRPACGVPMHRRQQSASTNQYSHNRRFSAISSSTNDDDDESRTTNEDEYQTAPQYSAIHKPPILPPRRERLTMIQELSPIQPVLNVSPARDFALPPPLSKEMRDWRPKHTSSVINAPAFTSLPKTNPRHPQFASPRARKPLNMYKYDEVIRRGEDTKRREISDKSSDSSLFGPKSPVRRRGLISSSPIRGRHSSTQPIRPEQFQLPAPVAKVWGIKGIVFLRMEMSREMLTIHVDKACYFSTESYRKNRSTYIQLELIHRSRDRHDNRKRSSHRSQSSGQRFKSRTIENTDEPHFDEYFNFNLFEENRRDYITISVFEKERANPELTRRKQLGCLTFHVSKILEKAQRAGCFEDDENGYAVEVNKDGFFILDASKGEKNNMPMAKIIKSKNYSLDGPSSTSSSSLNVHSPQKMLRSDWPPSSSLLPARSSSAIPPVNMNEQHTRPRPISYMEGLRYSEDMLPSFKMESFENSTGSSSIDYDFHRHRMTLPAITTSSSITSDEGPSCSSSTFNPSLLHAGGGDAKTAKGEEGDKKPSRQEGGVRRAASFTYSPTGSLGKHNRRPQAVVGKEDEAAKKKLFGPLTKTFSYIRSKMDSAISTSSLYPTKDEVRLWEASFEALLNHKYGQMLFTQFLKKEFSSENIEFWTECEEFKKMKDGKKSTTQKAHDIYREFVAEHSPKEVNLDSDTRAATKAAMETGCRTDTFTLAQGKIEQLMAKDSYRRFLKDKIYLDMLNNAEGKSDDQPAGENGVAK